MQEEKHYQNSFLPDPTAKIPAWGGLIMAQNCLMPNGPPKFDTVNVPPCKESILVQISLNNHLAQQYSITITKTFQHLIIFRFKAVIFCFLGQILNFISNFRQAFLISILQISMRIWRTIIFGLINRGNAISRTNDIPWLQEHTVHYLFVPRHWCSHCDICTCQRKIRQLT